LQFAASLFILDIASLIGDMRLLAMLALASATVLVSPESLLAEKPCPQSRLSGILDIENEMADKHGLTRIPDMATLRHFVKNKLLLALPGNPNLYYVTVPSQYRYVRPWVTPFILKLSQDFSHAFPGKKLKITSLVRTIKHQAMLERLGISDALGQSTHPTGSTFDISRLPLNEEEKQWMRRRLAADLCLRKINAIEEFKNNAFHVMVFPPPDFNIKKAQ